MDLLTTGKGIYDFVHIGLDQLVVVRDLDAFVGTRFQNHWRTMRSLIYHMLKPDERYIYGLDEVEINGV